MTVRHIRLEHRQFYLFEGLGINSGVVNHQKTFCLFRGASCNV